jgi:hypothetical protein
MIIPGQFGFNCPSGVREEAFWNIFPIGSNVKQDIWNQTAQEWSLKDPLQILRFLCRSEIQDGRHRYIP